MKTFESFLHVLMGFILGLLGLHILLTIREYRQLPPENDKYPVVFLQIDEYWSKSRVMDTLNDSREYVIGYMLAYWTIAILVLIKIL